MRRPSREYLLTLALGATGAGLVLISARQPWARAVSAAVSPLPAASVPVNGQDLLPLAAALGVASLAGLGALIATRSLARRLTGVVLAVFGAATAVGVCLHLSAGSVLAAARETTTSVSQSGSVTSGGATGGSVPSLGQSAHVVMMTFPWRGLALAGAVMVLVAGLITAWRGAGWPAMSSRYERPSRSAAAATDTASLWEALSRGMDPTDQRPR